MGKRQMKNDFGTPKMKDDEKIRQFLEDAERVIKRDLEGLKKD